jgi:hypothetical protein
MDGVTLSPAPAGARPGPQPDAGAGARGARWWAPRVALAGLALAALVGFLAFPTYPNYDSYYSLVWGRELLDGQAPTFEAYRAPTQHPLAIAFAAVLSLFGGVADRLLVGATVASFVVLAAGLYRLARVAFGALVGLIAAALLCTRFDFPFLALQAYVDVPYLALVIWAAALEAARPRRGVPVLALLAAAGLLRPEAWLLGGLYLLWCAPRADRARRIRLALLAALAPVAWAAVDLAVTGEPLFSLTHTTGLAEELGRQRGDRPVLSSTVVFLRGLDKAPVFFAGILGLGLSLALFRRRAAVPVALLVAGIGTFWLVALTGLSVVYRYLLVPSLMVMVFAAVTIGGWTLLARGSGGRRAWALVAGAAVLYGAAFTVTRVTPQGFVDELDFRAGSQASLVALLEDARVLAARRCGPVSVPNHKLVPQARWVLDAGERDVVARSDRRQRRRFRRGGVAIYAAEREAFLRYGHSPDPVRVAIPLPGYERVRTERYFSAYVRCPASTRP